MKRRRPVVLFSITNGWGIRNFLHTGLVRMVSKFADVGVATSQELHPFFEALQEQGEIVVVTALSSHESFFWQKIRQTKKAILQAKHNISTAKIKWHNLAHWPFAQVCLTASWSLQQILAAHWQLRMFEALEYSFANGKIPKLIKRPSLFVNCSPFDYRDNQLQSALHRSGVPSISIIPSWDNPSTKGCIFTSANIYLVWGEKQKQELLGYYPNITPERICISGIPQFDFYYQKLPDEYEREPFLKKLSINPKHKIILYATCSERLFPAEPEVVTDLTEAILQGRFGKDTHLLIRCHPADRAERYQHLCSSGLVTIFPSSVGATMDLYSWIPPVNETPVLAATLKHSEVCVNTASTITLDSFASGKPVVNVAYDGKIEKPYHQSVLRFYDYHHYFPIVDSGAVPMVRSAEEMIGAIKEAINDQVKLRVNRENVLCNFCFCPTEMSVCFIAKKIERMVYESIS